MTLILKQVRRCDGSCCIESPRFPNLDHSDCIYHSSLDGKESAGCMLMSGEKTIRGDEEVVKYEDHTHQSLFQKTCVEWPQNSRLGRGTGECCWQWASDG